MSEEREASLFRNGRNQAVRIPREFEFPGDKVIMRKVGKRLILEPIPRQRLVDVLSALKPLPSDDRFPEIDDSVLPTDTDPLA